MIVNNEVRFLAALATHKFRHLAHLSANAQVGYQATHRIMVRFRKEGLIETKKYHPTDATKSYTFTEIKLTEKGIRLAQICQRLKEEYERVCEDNERITDETANPTESDKSKM